MPGRKERNYGRGSLPEREEGYYCKGALPKRKGGLMQKGLDREGRRVLSQRRLLERDEGDFTRGEGGGSLERWLVREGERDCLKNFRGSKCVLCFFSEFSPRFNKFCLQYDFLWKKPCDI